MKITSGAFLITLLLSLASLSIACASRKIDTQDAKAAPRQTGTDDSSVPAGWKRYDFKEPLAFSMILPNKPEQRVLTLPVETETSHLFISAGDSGVYGAVYISDLPAVASRWESSGNKFFYELFIRDFAIKLENKGAEKSIDFESQMRFTTDRQVTINGQEALERNFAVGDFQGRTQLRRIGQAGFCIVAIWKQSTPVAERDAFFNSVKIAGEEH
jgi:hypothetical protein